MTQKEMDKRLIEKTREETEEREAIESVEETEEYKPFLGIPTLNADIQSENSNPMVKLCGMYWSKGYVTGTNGQQKYFLSLNKFKKSENQPDYQLSISANYSKISEVTGEKIYPPSVGLTGMWQNIDGESMKGGSGTIDFILLPNPTRTTEKSPHYFLYIQEK
jgi:hypothetical protein